MNDVLEKLHGVQRPSAPVAEQNSLTGRVQPTLKRRRIAHRIRRAKTAGIMALALIVPVLFSQPLLVHLPEPALRGLAELRDRFPKPRPLTLGWKESVPPNFSHEVESADLLVHGTVIGVTLNLEDLAKHAPIISCPAERPIGATIQFRVTRSYPEFDSETVTFESRLGYHMAMQIAAGDEYILGLKHLAEDKYAVVPTLMLRVGPGSRHVGFYGIGRAMTVEEFWDMAKVVYANVHNGTRPSPESIGQLQNSIRTGSLEQCKSALAILHMVDIHSLPPQDVVDALERHYVNGRGANIYAYRELVRSALDHLLQTADEASVDRLYTMYVDARYQGDSAFDDCQERLFRLFLKFPGSERRERIIQLLTTDEMVDNDSGGQRRVDLVDHKHDLFAAMAATPDAEIDRIFLEIANQPQEFGLKDYELSSLWSQMAQRGSQELRPLLERVLAAPADAAPKHPSEDLVSGAKRALGELRRNESFPAEPLETLIAEYDAGDQEVLHLIRKRFPADGSAYIPWLKTAPMREVADLIAYNAPDPSFVPLLTAALDAPAAPPLNPKDMPQYWGEHGDWALLLFALNECGATQEAVDRTVNYLESSPDEGAPRATGMQQEMWYFAQFRWRMELLKLVAYFGDRTAYPVIRSYLEERRLRGYYDAPTSTKFEGVSMDAERLHAAAIVAAARTGGTEALPILAEQLEQGHNRIKVVAAMALLYLGDHRGDDVLHAWVNWEEGYRGPLRFATGEWADWPPTVPIESILRSPELDALYVNMLRSGKHQFGPQLIVKSGIAEERKPEVLPILVDLLSNRDEITRDGANEALHRLTGQDFGFDPRRLIVHQEDVIAKWRAYVESLIGGPGEISPLPSP